MYLGDDLFHIHTVLEGNFRDYTNKKTDLMTLILTPILNVRCIFNISSNT